MKTAGVITICKSVLDKLSKIDNEVIGPRIAANQLIFPEKLQQNGKIVRISEQELRLLFIDELKKSHPDLFYSIETPTRSKYRFKGNYQNFTTGNSDCQSASTDLTIFENRSGSYERIFNIEFKFKGKEDSIAKDIFKLILEKENGAFIFLLKNSDNGTFCNNAPNRGLFKRFYHSIDHFNQYWTNPNKELLMVFLSMQEQKGMYKIISMADLAQLDKIFLLAQPNGTMGTLNGWAPI